MSVLLGQLVIPIALSIVGGLLIFGVYKWIRTQGAKDEQEKVYRAMLIAKDEAQKVMESYRAKDRLIDETSRERIERIAREAGKLPRGKEGEPFKFGGLLLFALPFVLTACTSLSAVPVVPMVDLPSRPLLAACPEPPAPSGVIVKFSDVPGDGLAVILPMKDAEAIRVYLTEAPRCWAEREILLDAHLQKLENRLKAVIEIGGRDGK